MSVGISLEELLTWNNEAADYGKAHLDANPALPALPCDIGGTKNVQEFVRHIWGVELRRAQLLNAPHIPADKRTMSRRKVLAHTFSRAASLGAVGNAGAWGRLPVGIPGRRFAQLGTSVEPDAGGPPLCSF